MNARPVALLLAIGTTMLLVLLNLFSHPAILSDPVEQHIFMQLSLPVLLTAILVGSALSMSSATLQVLLNNPLADPGIIGISSGASLSAGMLIVGGIIPSSALVWGLPVACFIGALLSSLLIFRLAQRLQLTHAAVILAGIAISTVCAAALAWLYLFGDAQATRNLTFWLMGSFEHTHYPILGIAGSALVFGMILLLRERSHLNALYLGEHNAHLIGVEPRLLTRKLLIICALLVGVSVSVAGSIAFVGLLVPHILRRLLGRDNRLIIPLSGTVGAALMVLIVNINTALSGVILPVSLLTASIGGPIFIYVLYRGQMFATQFGGRHGI